MSFHCRNGELYCEGLRVKEIQAQIPHSPFYLYSARQMAENFEKYRNALADLAGIVSYAVKANGNLYLLERLRKLGSWATLVSGGELELALAAGFDPENLIFNGNGKTLAELVLAVRHAVFINIDSDFDLQHIRQAAQKISKPVSVLLRVNPDIDPKVHPYVSTGLRRSKFGITVEQIPAILEQLKKAPTLKLVGVHCHLGSTLENPEIFRHAMVVMAKVYEDCRSQGFPMAYLNLGGGLGIQYHRQAKSCPEPADIVAALEDLTPQNATLILEPGRSIVGKAGILVCKVIGLKKSGSRNFIVSDGSMAELIRPSLYQAYHEIGFVEPVPGERRQFDIVGPVCESADFLGKARSLPTPPEGTGLVVYDAGAYGYAMSSNYNARLRPPEYLVDGDELILIRRAEAFEDRMQLFEERII